MEAQCDCYRIIKKLQKVSEEDNDMSSNESRELCLRDHKIAKVAVIYIRRKYILAKP